ncbi:MAG: lycopene cyclase [Saprospiraceae bacterium]|nr:lycopene cyclase [Saprospiraceae bacterium]
MEIIYDYIIAGTGAAGLMMAYRMAGDPYFDNKSILLLERDDKKVNDRTWCYWEEGDGEWDHLTTKIWNKIYFGSPSFSKVMPLGNYQYKMIRSSIFYSYLIQEIKKHSSFHLVKSEITGFEENEGVVSVFSHSEVFKGLNLLSSIPDTSVLNSQAKYPYLKQHFKGWFIKTDKPVFDPELPVFMDFDLPQKGHTRFMYSLPTSPTEALIEYTLFSEDLLSEREYDKALADYLEKKGISNFTIEETERGNIPMTCYPFERHNTKNIMYIGSAGGWTKPSTGYTFARTTEITKKLISFLKSEGDFTRFSIKNRYWFYDLVLLDVLHNNNETGIEIFTSIFKNNSIRDVFRFLDEKGSILNDLKILFLTRPIGKFTMSFARRISFLP